MHVISHKAIVQYAAQYPDAATQLDAWYRVARAARWQSLVEVRIVYPHADPVDTCTVFNIKGNNYRLITKIYYDDQTILIRAFLTHAEYDREGWKDDCRPKKKR